MPMTDFYPTYDGQGNMTAPFDETGTEVLRCVYTAFGERLDVLGDSSLTPFQWNGRWGYYYDEDLGEYHVRARPYEPTQANWLTVDPLRTQLLKDTFLYAANNPLTHIDPSGLDYSIDRTEVGQHKGMNGRYAILWTFQLANGQINDRDKPLMLVQQVHLFVSVKNCDTGTESGRQKGRKCSNGYRYTEVIGFIDPTSNSLSHPGTHDNINAIRNHMPPPDNFLTDPALGMFNDMWFFGGCRLLTCGNINSRTDVAQTVTFTYGFFAEGKLALYVADDTRLLTVLNWNSQLRTIDKLTCCEPIEEVAPAGGFASRSGEQSLGNNLLLAKAKVDVQLFASWDCGKQTDGEVWRGAPITVDRR